MTNKERVVQKPAKKGSISPAQAKAAVKKVMEDRETPTKAPIKPKVKRSYNKNAKVASEAKIASEQYAEPTVGELKAGQLNLTKLLMVSNEKLNKALNDIDKITQDFMDLRTQSWWSITKERFVFTLKCWIMRC